MWSHGLNFRFLPLAITYSFNWSIEGEAEPSSLELPGPELNPYQPWPQLLPTGSSQERNPAAGLPWTVKHAFQMIAEFCPLLVLQNNLSEILTELEYCFYRLTSGLLFLAILGWDSYSREGGCGWQRLKDLRHHPSYILTPDTISKASAKSE